MPVELPGALSPSGCPSGWLPEEALAEELAIELPKELPEELPEALSEELPGVLPGAWPSCAKASGHDDLVVLDADLAAATKTGMFRKAHPDRHFDCGIAEGNMMGVAAGLATMGYVHSNIGTLAFALGFVIMMILDVALG